MSLTAATLIPGLLLILLGVPLLLNHSGYAAILKAFPRSTTAAFLFFGVGAAWFLHAIWNLSPADFGEYRTYLFIGFLLVAILSFKCVPDFLAVRGLATIVLMGAMPLLQAAYMEYGQTTAAGHGDRRLSPHSRPPSGWARNPGACGISFPGCSRNPGGRADSVALLAAYGVILSIVAFTY